ncbi:SDR family oxidoreductase [Marivita sp. XM-24bin2]|jgi:nucleoside-diphosphate-sugar epimerase|uniref:SDR family oxidoreductase n=1 Tax=unclassified Marivita TaxID=2632480 RepID=UPI000D7957C2|nr:SDR family oxidoreductase [Marivita sp. XM-24bin2]MCR9107674.1 SDR family oxidoreductase [Paracoccaceae bacterium]PWL35521.1 MAG: NAD(P)-dependent oxidoreductase [Marivita sp. XM-24bin2]
MEKTLLSLGHGYSAAYLARRLLPKGWKIAGTTRDPDKFEAFHAQGITPLLWDRDAILPWLENASHVLVSAGPTDSGDPTLALLAPDIAEHAHRLDWLGYLSTTGVYGDAQGGWVDETAPLTPTTERGRRRVQAEAAWSAIPDLPLHIFRLAGIYGPGRGPFSKVRDGTARRIIKSGQVFSRIHVEDIAQTLEASMEAPNPGTAYNLCDDDPAPPQDVILHAASLLGVEAPPEVPFDEADLSPMARSFYAESKRVRNDRIKDDLQVTLKYPDYRTGLAAILAAERTGQ